LHALQYTTSTTVEVKGKLVRPSDTDGAEEGTNVFDKRFGLLKCSEVAASIHVGPVGDVVAGLAPGPRHTDDLFGERCNTRGQLDRVAAAEGTEALPVQPCRRCAGSGGQYSMMLSSISSRLSAFSGWPLQSVQAQNFSMIHAS
jgi:hypothetical protein